jgi:ABC-type xylose transport system permease subunit
MAALRSGCDQLEVPNRYEDIIIGAIIVAAVTLDQLRQRRPAG